VRFSLGNCGHESKGDVRQIRAAFGSILLDTTNQVAFPVGHDPRAVATPAVPRSGDAEVGGFHGAVVIVAAVDLRVVIVEAAAGIEVLAIHDPALSFRLVFDGGASHIVMAQAHAR
jgi:hypothetical protein